MFRLKSTIPSNLSDEKLFSGIINGNEDMFEELYNRYSKRLLYYFYRMLSNDEQLAQDFVQEIFFKLLNKPELFNPAKKFSTWIFSIAHNMCKNEYRSRDVRKIIVKNENLDSFSSFEPNDNLTKGKVQQIYKELESFDDSHRTAFLLKYREGLDIKEISEILKIPVGTVKSRLFNTRKKIYTKISETTNTNCSY